MAAKRRTIRIEDRIDAFVRDITLIIRDHAQLAVRQALAERRRALIGTLQEPASSRSETQRPELDEQEPSTVSAAEPEVPRSSANAPAPKPRRRRGRRGRGTKAKQLSLF